MDSRMRPSVCLTRGNGEQAKTAIDINPFVRSNGAAFEFSRGLQGRECKGRGALVQDETAPTSTMLYKQPASHTTLLDTVSGGGR